MLSLKADINIRKYKLFKGLQKQSEPEDIYNLLVWGKMVYGCCLKAYTLLKFFFVHPLCIYS